MTITVHVSYRLSCLHWTCLSSNPMSNHSPKPNRRCCFILYDVQTTVVPIVALLRRDSDYPVNRRCEFNLTNFVHQTVLSAYRLQLAHIVISNVLFCNLCRKLRSIRKKLSMSRSAVKLMGQGRQVRNPNCSIKVHLFRYSFIYSLHRL